MNQIGSISTTESECKENTGGLVERNYHRANSEGAAAKMLGIGLFSAWEGKEENEKLGRGKCTKGPAPSSFARVRQTLSR